MNLIHNKMMRTFKLITFRTAIGITVLSSSYARADDNTENNTAAIEESAQEVANILGVYNNLPAG